MFDRLRDDIRTVLERDPAARSSLEVLLCYPGVHALAFHRLGHHLWRSGWTTAARGVSVVVREVPANCVVVGVPGRVTYKDGQRVDGVDLNQTDLPDPVTKALEQLMERIRTLEAEVETLRKTVDKEERA